MSRRWAWYNERPFTSTVLIGLTGAGSCLSTAARSRQSPRPGHPAALRRVLQGPTLQQGRHLGLTLVFQGVEKILKCHQIVFERKMHIEFRRREIVAQSHEFSLQKRARKEASATVCPPFVPIERTSRPIGYDCKLL